MNGTIAASRRVAKRHSDFPHIQIRAVPQWVCTRCGAQAINYPDYEFTAWVRYHFDPLRNTPCEPPERNISS